MAEVELKDLAKEVALKHGKALANEMLDIVIVPALEAAVAKSATPIDDVVIAALKAPLKLDLIDLFEKI